MKQLSTVAKGDFFEEQVYNLITEMLEKGNLGLDNKSSKIFWKKPYYSEARKRDIIFDISIETYINNSEKYSWLTIFECKNYSHAVPVDDVEEFDSKLSQIGEHNTKGFIFTKIGFQSGAFDFACSKKIGLAKVLSKDKIDWVNYRKNRNNDRYNKEQAEFCLSTNSNDERFFSFFNHKSFESLPDLLINLGIIDKYIPKQADIFIRFKTPENLEQIIHQLPTDNFYENDKLNHDNLCKSLSEIYGVEFVFDKSLEVKEKSQILGKITFSPLVILITKELLTDIHRWRFTLAHEIGHLILHYQILKEYIDDNLDIEKSMSLDGGIPEGLNKRMEVQANMFASRMLIPHRSLIEDVQRYFIKEEIHKGFLYLDHQRCNINLVNNLLNELKYKHEVSKEVAKYRLEELKLLLDKNSYSQ